MNFYQEFAKLSQQCEFVVQTREKRADGLLNFLKGLPKIMHFCYFLNRLWKFSKIIRPLGGFRFGQLIKSGFGFGFGSVLDPGFGFEFGTEPGLYLGGLF